MKKWSDSLVVSLEKKVEENRSNIEKAFEENERLRQESRQQEDDILLSAVDEATTTQYDLDLSTSYFLERRVNEIADDLLDGTMVLSGHDSGRGF